MLLKQLKQRYNFKTTPLSDAQWSVILVSGLFLLIVFAALTGVLQLEPAEIWQALAKKSGIVAEEMSAKERAWWNIRLPRILLALVVGAALAVSGAAMQAIFRNPLVEPGLVGVSSGAALFAALTLIFAGSFTFLPDDIVHFYLLPLGAFAGGLIATYIIYYLGKGQSMAVFILAGVAVNAFCGALIGLVVFHADDAALRSFTFWSLGDLSGASWSALSLVYPLIVLSALFLWKQHKAYDALALGDQQAFHMGVDVEGVKKKSIVAVALAVGAAVAISGAIGFLGLVVPHLIRLMFGPVHRKVLAFSALLGAALLLLADTYSRIAVQPAELPVGIVTALMGAPFFIYLIYRLKSKIVF